MKKKTQGDIIQTFKSVLNRLSVKRKRQFWLLLIGMIVLAGLETIAAGTVAFFASTITDPEKVLHSSYIVILKKEFNISSLNDVQGLLIFLSLTVAIVIILKNVVKCLVTYFISLYGTNIAAFIGDKLLTGFLHIPYQWHLTRNSADLGLQVNWRYQFSSFINSFLNILSDSLIVFVLLGAVFFVTPAIALALILVVGVTAFFILTRFRLFLDHIAVRIKNHRISINNLVHKSLHGVKDVKVYKREHHFINDYRSQAYLDAKLSAVQKVATQAPSWIMEAIGITLLTVSVCFLYIVMDASAAKATGTIALMTVAAWRVLPATSRMMGSLTQIRASMPFIRSHLEYLSEIDYYGVNQANEKEIDNLVFQREILLKDVSFSYHGADTDSLNSINVNIPKGGTIGVIGFSGAGKSTLADLMIGLLSPTSGYIKIDDVILTPQNIAGWMQKIGYVPQAPYICDGTLAENVAFGFSGDEIDRSHVLECCEKAAMGDFLGDLPNGIDTSIGERGVRLSGGQQQRVAIARALYKNPEIMVFDEATSSLDAKTEQNIRKTIYSFKGKQTMLIIAHRLSTVEDCDTLIWLEKGKVRQIDTPEKILPAYRLLMKDEKSNQVEVQ